MNKSEAKAKEALSRLQGGESFKKVVKDLSTDPATKQQDGRLLGIAQGQQEKALDTAVFAAKRNELGGPIKTQQGYYVFKVTRITPASKQGLEQSKEGIRQLLISQTQQKALDNFTPGIPLRSGATRPTAASPTSYPTARTARTRRSRAPVVHLRRGTGTPPALGGASLVPQAGIAPGAPGRLAGRRARRSARRRRRRPAGSACRAVSPRRSAACPRRLPACRVACRRASHSGAPPAGRAAAGSAPAAEPRPSRPRPSSPAASAARPRTMSGAELAAR